MGIQLDPTVIEQLENLAEKENITVDTLLQQWIDQHNNASQYNIESLFDETDLGLSKIRYRGLFEQSNDAVFLLNLDGQHVASNQRASELLGYTVDELISMSFRDIVKQDELQHSEITLSDLVAGKKPAPYQRTFIHQDGREIPVEINVECIFDDDEPLYIQSIVRDVRERHKLLEELQHSERQFRAIFNSAFTFMGLMRPDGILIEANQTALDFAGITIDDVIGKPFWDAHWWQLSQEIQDQLKDAIQRATNGEFIRYEVAVRGAGDIVALIDFSIKPMFDDDGVVILLVPEGRDITEQKEMERKIQESEIRHRTILEAMAEGIVIHDANGAITMANPSAEKMLGLSLNQLQGLTSIDPLWHTIREDGSLFPGEEHPASITLQTGKRQTNVVMGVHKPNGMLTWISITSVPLRQDAETVGAVIATFTDITVLKLAQDQIIEFAVENERMSVLAHFIQASSHEFRTPLAIIGTSEYILRKQFDGNESALARLELIQTQVRRINRLVSRLHLMAELDAISAIEINTQVAIQRLVEELVQLYKPQFNDKQLTCVIKSDLTEDIKIPSQNDYLMQAIRELIDNAIRHSSTNDVINISLTTHANSIGLTIADTGIGISEDDIPHIFERFWRKDTAHAHEGFGLGLPIALRIIELHNATLTIESTLDEGTVVHIVFLKDYPHIESE